MSSCTTSATRRSRSVVRAVFTAVAAAASHYSVLVPISSVTRYTLMTFPSVWSLSCDIPTKASHRPTFGRRSGCGDRGRGLPPIVAVSASQHKQRLDAGRRLSLPKGSVSITGSRSRSLCRGAEPVFRYTWAVYVTSVLGIPGGRPAGCAALGGPLCGRPRAAVQRRAAASRAVGRKRSAAVLTGRGGGDRSELREIIQPRAR